MLLSAEKTCDVRLCLFHAQKYFNKFSFKLSCFFLFHSTHFIASLFLLFESMQISTGGGKAKWKYMMEINHNI